ncbi:uncharacterized protein LOC113236016 isoform X2 [Hyposmocoma kahamanoa]|nr:uncharacterized protein LOC113236016 isoform X2 [Hyposmocoma kahamanoa]XP_026327733.1 uncharacterized protein LOC113236016 isoform X2 [Hyposmocoma kahamanoa]
MYKVMIQSQGASGKVYVKAGAEANRIPSGLNLGGFCMMRMQDSVLFFHRLKLRNDTFFRLNYLHTDVDKMIITARLALNDLHLSGSYERAITDKDPSNLFYRPTFGNIIFLLRNVQYQMEGRYRLVQNKLMVENIISNIHVPEALMNYVVNGTLQTPEKLQVKSIEEFVNKIRIDMDKWLKHYFNDYLLYFELGPAGSDSSLREYDVKKAYELNTFVDQSITAMRKRLFEIRCANVKIPNFQIFTINGMEIKLRDGVVRGLDSMHRRSVATGKDSDGKMRKVDVVIGFSNLKVEYKYDATLAPGTTVMHGMFILTADDLTASLDISLVSEPEFVDLKFDFLEQPKPESLVVEGPINRRIANIRHLLENHIISLMSNMLYYQITMLKTLTHCAPKLIPHMDPGDDYDPSADENAAKKEADYAANRQDSIEIEIPGKPGKPRKRMKIQYGEKFALIDLGDILGSPTSPPDRKEDSPQDHDDKPHDIIDTQLTENTLKPVFPYGLSRVDSAEVVINKEGVPKTFHIKYNENFDVNDNRNAKQGTLDDTEDKEEATKKRTMRINRNLREKKAKFVLSKILRDKRNGILRNKSLVKMALPVPDQKDQKVKYP